MGKAWTGPVVRAACGHDLAVTPARQISYFGIWCGHRDVHGRLTSDRRVQPVAPEEAYKCECVRMQ
jgi:hypothetical protein